MEQNLSSKKEFSVAERAKSFAHAGRGVKIFLRTTHNAWIHITILIIAIGLGIYFGITHIEWILLVLTAGLVLSAEAFNTAIEIDMNLTSPEYHPCARDTKDVAAGAVFISAVTAFIVGLGIFVPYVVGF